MPNKYLIIVNPKSGKKNGLGLTILEDVKTIFRDARAELVIEETQYAGHAEEIARSRDLDGFNGLCALGGDGTMHEVVNGMMLREEPGPPLGIIPGGTGNSFMQDLDCVDPYQATELILSGKTQYIDVAKVTMGETITYACNIIGWGLIPDINVMAEKLRWMGEQRYNVAGIFKLLLRKIRRARLVVNDRNFSDDFVFIMACNTKHTGKGMMVAPNAELNDGAFDILIVRALSRLQLLTLFPKIFTGEHIHSEHVEIIQTKAFALYPDDVPEVLNIDGELKGSAPIEVEVINSAVEVYVEDQRLAETVRP